MAPARRQVCHVIPWYSVPSSNLAIVVDNALPPPHGIRLAAVKWSHRQGSHLPKGVALGPAGPEGRRRRKARRRIPIWLLQSASHPRNGEWGGGGAKARTQNRRPG